MKKFFGVCLAICLCFSLTACDIQTPQGTIHIGFDESQKSEQTRVIDENGNVTTIPLGSIKDYVDGLLDQVAIPNGGTTSELKSFVYDTLGTIGIDLNALEGDGSIEDTIRDTLENAGFDDDVELTPETEQKIEEAIRSALEDAGVDTSELEINVEDWLNEKEANK